MNQTDFGESTILKVFRSGKIAVRIGPREMRSLGYFARNEVGRVEYFFNLIHCHMENYNLF